MLSAHHIANHSNQTWTLDDISLSYNIIDYTNHAVVQVSKDNASVRLHFGLQGKYSFHLNQIDRRYDLVGHHNNMIYSQGLDMSVHNKSDRIITFGIEFTKDAFIGISKHGNDPLKRLTDRILKNENSILSDQWKTNTIDIQRVIDEIVTCPYQKELRDLFLWSKTLELVVLQASLYDDYSVIPFIRSARDQKLLAEAKDILDARIDSPPSIAELSKLSGVNEFKLKKGFKELFGTTIFGYIHHNRMRLARKLLLETQKSAKEIAFETGYSSPQHFSNAFKKEFGVTPNSIRNRPDSAISR